MFIDTHCHPNFNAYKDDAPEVIQRSLENNTWMIIVGSQSTTSKRAVEYANKYKKGVYGAVGLHPIHLENIEVDEEEIQFSSRAEEFDYEYYKNLAEDAKVVAIGETGLDYYRLPKEKPEEEVKEKQIKVFNKHIDLAEELGLPIIIHCREAHDDLLKILTDRFSSQEMRGRGVTHCFSGDLNLAKKYIDLGFLIGFTGLITFNQGWDEVIRELPLDKILIETDAPYLTPAPFRGKRNEPMHVKFVAGRIAELKGMNEEQVGKQIFENALKLFNKIKDRP